MRKSTKISSKKLHCLLMIFLIECKRNPNAPQKIVYGIKSLKDGLYSQVVMRFCKTEVEEGGGVVQSKIEKLLLSTVINVQTLFQS